MKNLGYSMVLFIGLIGGCEKNNIEKDPVPVEDVQAIARMTRDFGWDLFREVAKGVSDENVLISPLSVQTALSMAVNGAGSTTLEEMLAVLECGGCDVKDINTRTAQLRVLMEEQSGHPRLTSANGYFYDDNRIHVLETFIQTLSSDYRAGFQTYDFGDVATVDKINKWVEDHTAGKIDKIIEDISDYDLAFLINALHFKADWATGFAEESTVPGFFTTGEQTQVPVQYVSADRNFSTTEKESFRMVDLPFRDSTYTMSFIQASGTLADQPGWANQLTSADLKEMWDNMTYDRAMVSFPKLDVEFDDDLIPSLKSMGMVKAFSEAEADFSKMGHALIGPVIYISKVRHKAVLKVDEKGAEGAAVTSIGFSTTSAPPVFSFQKPFVIVLRHTQTNSILFAGLINDPS